MNPERKLIAAVINWWESQRPLGWTMADHLAEPDHNAGPTFWDSELAEEVAEYIKKTRNTQNQ